MNQGYPYSLCLTGDQVSPGPVERHPPELARYEIDQIGDLIALCQSLITGKAAILSPTPRRDNLHDIRLLSSLQVRCILQQAEHRILRIGFHLLGLTMSDQKNLAITNPKLWPYYHPHFGMSEKKIRIDTWVTSLMAP